ncbi:conserved hypothetical protein [Photobacterium leiognathi lrivu.4.1]|uniref:Glycine zipper family protein n=1 Tax=Photobacterium leiognathi lrivu.4.1 TaxID=1248232 RepID=V5F7T8_PHOLE|nr:hypothetical protein [Photobacterium leiognathi]GAD31399.1 conserved hypothetical protein [Photobacterium leiognathi lrivu.4.1]
MYKLTMAIFAVFASQSANASCTKLVQNHMYLLKEGVEYCIDIEDQYALLEMGKGNDMAEISDKNKTVFEIMYPQEQLIVKDQFIVTSFSDMHLTYSNDFIYLENAPKKRRKRNAVKIFQAAGAGVMSAAGSQVAGGEPNYAAEAVGAMFGAAATPITGPFLGSAIGGFISENIKKGGNIKRPLTRINTGSGLKSSGMRAFSRVSSARSASCSSSCH